jgi:hypothetical protein
MTKYKVIGLIIFLLFFYCQKFAVSNPHKSPIYLNHVLFTVDDTTFFTINNSDFLRDIFASIRTPTTQSDNSKSWLATYISGQNTYIELFNKSNEKNQGFSGVAFGIETVGGVDSLYRSIPDSDSSNFVKIVMPRNFETGQSPWFYYLTSTLEDSSSSLHTFVMEYDFEYMKYIFPDNDPEEINITRKLYNNSYRDDLLLKDIIELELALNKFDTNKLLKDFKIYGYQIKHKGKLTIGTGPDIKIIIRTKSELKSGICRIKFSLTDKQYEPQTILFGHKSKLILNRDRTAEWHFDI